MKRLLVLFFSLLIIFPVAADFLQTRPEASVFGEKTAAIATADFLPTDQAFRLEVVETNDQTINIQFIIADGYYLYKSSFAFASDNPKVKVDTPVLPEGIQKQDEFLGDVEVYYNVLDIQIPISNPDDLAFNLQVKYQGCAEKGLCYPQETATLPIAGILPIPPSSTEAPAIFSLKESLAALSWADIFYYFLIGLGLAFTPCVFPMLPILSGIILRGKPGTLRSQVLAAIYILSMAITYAILGVLIGLFGAELNLQARLQSVWVLVPFAIFFVFFALAMFGLFELRLPAFITNPLNRAADRSHGGSFLSAAFLGVCSSLVISPCVTAPFAGILLHIGATGDAIGGGISLFALGLGMGVPLFIIAAGGGAFLPKVGNWMVIVRNIFGVMLLAVAIWLIARIVPSYIELALWGLLAAGVAIFIGTLDVVPYKTKGQRFIQLIGLFLLVYAICAWVGAWQGNTDPLQPLKGQVIMNGQLQQAGQTTWHTIKTKAELDKLLLEAKSANKPVLLDWYADWCVSCKKMEHEIFQAPDVLAKLANYQLIRLDITETTKEQRDLLNNYKLIGPPAVLFFNGQGDELIDAHIVGEIDKAGFLENLQKINK